MSPRNRGQAILLGEDYSSHAAEKHRDVEVDQNAERAVSRLEVGAHLDEVHCCKRLDGLELDDQALRDQQIDSAVAHGVRLVLDSYWYLASEWNPSQRELHAEGVVVYRLEETWPQLAMDLDGSDDNR